MAEFPALPLWTDAYLGDTTHLSTIEHGAYLLLLITAWRTATCDLPDDDRMLAKFCRLTMGQWMRIRPAIMPYWQAQKGRLLNGRLRDEREAVRRLTQQRSDAGRSSALKRLHRNATTVQRGGNETPTPTPTPILTPKKEEVVPAALNGAADRKHGTRWPSEAVVPEEWIEAGEMSRLRNRRPPVDLRLEAEKFTNFWASKSGRDATKLDWRKTWLVWTLNAQAPKDGRQRPPTAHDNFLAAAAEIVREIEAGAAGGQHENDLVVAPRSPLLPP